MSTEASKDRTRRWLAALAAGVATTTIGVATTASPASAWATNTGQSSTGAYLQSAGICGLGEFNFTVTSEGFEYIQLGLITSAGTIWSDAASVDPSFARSTLPVNAFANLGYSVIGWDWTSVGWEGVQVLTSFWHAAGDSVLDFC